MQAKILCVSFDGAVSDIRCAALREAGHMVTPALTIAEAREVLSGDKFDLVILGHRFSREEKRSLASMARDECSTPVLLVQSGSVDLNIPADSRVYALEGTAALLNAAELLLAKHKPAAA
jgi:DNA-binding response OmpR family regulator